MTTEQNTSAAGLLREARNAIAALPEFALGGVVLERTDGSGISGQYGVRDELVSRIDAFFAAEKAAAPSGEAEARNTIPLGNAHFDAARDIDGKVVGVTAHCLITEDMIERCPPMVADAVRHVLAQANAHPAPEPRQTREALREKIARALFERNGLDIAWEECFDSTRENYRDQADAILSALGERP